MVTDVSKNYLITFTTTVLINNAKTKSWQDQIIEFVPTWFVVQVKPPKLEKKAHVKVFISLPCHLNFHRPCNCT